MMTGCLNVTYHEAVNIALSSEEEYRKHKEAKKKKVPYGSSSGNQKRQKTIPRTISIPLFIHHNYKPGNRHLFILLQLYRTHISRMLLAFVPHSRRATISLTIPAIIVERQGISRGSVRTQGNTIKIFRKLLCPNNRTRTSSGAIIIMPRRARPRRKLDKSSTCRLGQYQRESPS
jgi:hypothetical protein